MNITKLELDPHHLLCNQYFLNQVMVPIVLLSSTEKAMDEAHARLHLTLGGHLARTRPSPHDQ